MRHRSWLAKDTFAQLSELLQKHAVALCLVQHAWMPALETTPRRSSTSAGWAAARTSRTTTFARAHQSGCPARSLVGAGEELLRKGLIVYGYFNNHYQGHSPASVRAMQMRLDALPRIGEGPTSDSE